MDPFSLLTFLAVIDFLQYAPLVTAVVAIVGIIFAALKYNRDDSTALVSQQSSILTDMNTLNTRLETTANRLQVERDQLEASYQEAKKQIEGLQSKIYELQEQIKMLRKELRQYNDEGIVREKKFQERNKNHE